MVGLVKAIVDLNVENTVTKEGRPKPLALLDISFLNSVTLANLESILDFTDLNELLIWDNPSLPQEEVAKVAKGRIAKLTTRARFLEPLERRDSQHALEPRCPAPYPARSAHGSDTNADPTGCVDEPLDREHRRYEAASGQARGQRATGPAGHAEPRRPQRREPGYYVAPHAPRGSCRKRKSQ